MTLSHLPGRVFSQSLSLPHAAFLVVGEVTQELSVVTLVLLAVLSPTAGMNAGMRDE